MADNELYRQAIEFLGGESRLGKHVKEFIEKDRQGKIEQLIELGCNSTDKNVARMAWSLTFTAGIMAELQSIKDEVENPPKPGEEVPPYE